MLPRTVLLSLFLLTPLIAAAQGRSDLQQILDRLDRLENRALKENLALSDLLVRLESVLVSARQYWYHKTTLLNWMIVTLVLIVLDRLLLHFPQIVKIVEKLS